MSFVGGYSVSVCVCVGLFVWWCVGVCGEFCGGSFGWWGGVGLVDDVWCGVVCGGVGLVWCGL